MKKFNFVSGNAKLALAAFAVASFTLTSCEKEDFDVNVPDINFTVPDVSVDGVANVILTATSASGNDLAGVTFTTSTGSTLEGNKSLSYTSATTLVVTAAKEGYLSVTKTIVVPQPQKNAVITIPVEFVLNAEKADVNYEAPTVGDEIAGTEGKVKGESTVTNGTYLTPGEHIYPAQVPTGVKYTSEQIQALYTAVNELAAPDSRGAEDDEAKANLQIAKDLLRAQIAALPTEWNTVTSDVPYTLSEAASSLTVVVTTPHADAEMKLAAEVANQTYTIKGTATLAGESIVQIIDAKGVDISHSHDHGHGNGNAGGGTGE